jgi:hypothetical protein
MKQTAHGWKNIEIGPSRRFRARSVLIEQLGRSVAIGLVPSGPLIRGVAVCSGLKLLILLASLPSLLTRFGGRNAVGPQECVAE